MYHRFHVTLASLILAFLFSANSVQGATSYLMIQGEFDGTSAGVETYKWKVDYTGSSLITGQDLFLAVFGPQTALPGSPVQYATYVFGNTTHGVSTIYYDGLGYAPQQFYAQGLSGPLTPSPYEFGKYWAYYNAGGGYDDTSGWVDPTSAPYADNLWVEGSTGASNRKLLDRDLDANLGEPSYDAWVFEGTGLSGNPADQFTGLQTVFYTDPGSNFTVYSIAAAPEPSRGILLLLAGIALVTRRRRSLPSSC